MRLTRHDAGSRLRVPAGELIEVTLPENATTGYRWRLDAPENFEQVEDRSTVAEFPRGAAGSRTLTLRPLAAGSAELRLVKRRSWESSSAEEYVVQLDIEPA